MKSLTELNQIVREIQQSNPNVNIEIFENGLLVKEQHDDDDSSYLVTIYQERNKEIYRHDVIIYPWQNEKDIKKNILLGALEFTLKMSKV